MRTFLNICLYLDTSKMIEFHTNNIRPILCIYLVIVFVRFCECTLEEMTRGIGELLFYTSAYPRINILSFCKNVEIILLFGHCILNMLFGNDFHESHIRVFRKKFHGEWGACKTTTTSKIDRSSQN